MQVILALVSCQKDVVTNNEEVSMESASSMVVSMDISAPTVVGEKIPNPLNIANIKKAFKSLDVSVKSGYTEDDIEPTHKYVAFTPTCEDELYALMADSTLDLYLYPLDYEVSDGLVTADPRFVIDGFSYRWSYVPVDYDFSSVKCPYIYYYDIFDPEDDYWTRSGNSLPRNLVESLERESYAICGQDVGDVLQTKSSSVTPSGRILFYDTTLKKLRGVEGLSVKAQRGTHKSYGHCDSDGYFTCDDSFKHKWTYHIFMSRTDFEVRKGTSTDEVVYKYSDYKGPISRSYTDTLSSFYSAISRAALVYYYGENQGLRRPPMKNDNSARLAIQAIDKADDSNYGTFHVNPRWILSDRPILKIFSQSRASVYRESSGLFGTTIHELAHASHWRRNHDGFYDTDDIVVESFARGVQWVLTSKEYSEYEPSYYRQSYTGIAQDLIDGYGSKKSKFYGTWVNCELKKASFTKSYYDNVTGFSPAQVEAAVRKSKTWTEWEYNMKNDYPGIASNTDISAAFTYWNSAE